MIGHTSLPGLLESCSSAGVSRVQNSRTCEDEGGSSAKQGASLRVNKLRAPTLASAERLLSSVAVSAPRTAKGSIDSATSAQPTTPRRLAVLRWLCTILVETCGCTSLVPGTLSTATAAEQSAAAGCANPDLQGNGRSSIGRKHCKQMTTKHGKHYGIFAVRGFAGI